MASKKARVFLDSNVFFSGIITPYGKPNLILILGEAGIIKILICELILEEVEYNLRKKFPESIKEYKQILQAIHPEIVPLPSMREVEEYENLIRSKKDAPILTAAILSQPDYLITGNTRHFTKEVANLSKLNILTPAEFLGLYPLILRQ